MATSKSASPHFAQKRLEATRLTCQVLTLEAAQNPSCVRQAVSMMLDPADHRHDLLVA